MNLLEMARIIDFYERNGHKNDIVLVTLSQPSVGARASVGIQSIDGGFDWESGQIRITADEPIIKKYNDRDVGKPAICEEVDYGTRKRIIWKCPICENHLSKSDKYCSCCGQAIAR